MSLFLNTALAKARFAVNDFIRDEEGDVNIVSMVVLIGIAVLLAVVFKNQVKGLIETLFTTIQGTATNAVSGS